MYTPPPPPPDTWFLVGSKFVKLLICPTQIKPCICRQTLAAREKSGDN